MISKFNYFSGLVTSIYRNIQRLERNELIKFGYRGSYTQYLLYLSDAPDGLTLGELCEKSDHDKAAVSRALSEMEYQNLVTRNTADGTARRAPFVLTENGKKLSNHVLQCVARVTSAVSEELTEEEREVLYRALERIEGKLQQQNAGK